MLCVTWRSSYSKCFTCSCGYPDTRPQRHDKGGGGRVSQGSACLPSLLTPSLVSVGYRVRKLKPLLIDARLDLRRCREEKEGPKRRRDRGRRGERKKTEKKETREEFPSTPKQKKRKSKTNMEDSSRVLSSVLVQVYVDVLSSADSLFGIYLYRPPQHNRKKTLQFTKVTHFEHDATSRCMRYSHLERLGSNRHRRLPNDERRRPCTRERRRDLTLDHSGDRSRSRTRRARVQASKSVLGGGGGEQEEQHQK